MKHRKGPVAIALHLEAWPEKKSSIMERFGHWRESGLPALEGFSAVPLKRMRVSLMRAHRAVIDLLNRGRNRTT